MRTIHVKNFGPIKDSGLIEVRPVTVFCGNQGTGKSTVAKLISMMSWIEKALVRKDVTVENVKLLFVEDYCSYHYLEHYFNIDSFIEYTGDVLHLLYKKGSVKIELGDASSYKMPQIMYVPAERNLMVAIENAERISNLPPALVTLMEVYRKALTKLRADLKLPVNGFAVHYDKKSKTTWLTDGSFQIQVHEAASGLQSVIPLMMVTKFLMHQIEKGTSRDLSAEERERLQKEISDILQDKSIDENVRKAVLNTINSRFKNECFMNIVEEPEQNLFPTTQRQVVYELLDTLHKRDGNVLIMTTHSPYVLNDLTLAVKAGDIKKKAGRKNAVLKKLGEIVALGSCLAEGELAVYQINDTDGEVAPLPLYEGIPDDNNFLNSSLEDSNLLFDQLIELEDELA